MTGMMTVTRIYSEFDNVADSVALGVVDAPRTDVCEYPIPDGYTIDKDDNVLRDPAGIECALLPTVRGVQIMSLSGHEPDVFISALVGRF